MNDVGPAGRRAVEEGDRVMLVRIYDNMSGMLLGDLPESDLQFLVSQLEEESSQDTDYYLTVATVEMLEQAGASPALLELLRRALGESGEGEIRWQTESDVL
jgi:hypothetical protein